MLLLFGPTLCHAQAKRPWSVRRHLPTDFGRFSGPGPSGVDGIRVVWKRIATSQAKTVGENKHESFLHAQLSGRLHEIDGLPRGVQRVISSFVIGKIDDKSTVGSASAAFDGAA